MMGLGISPSGTCPSRRPQNLLVINGHPDPSPRRYCSALCDAFVDGLKAGIHRVEHLRVGCLPLIDDQANLELGADLAKTVARIRDADRLFVFFPMWLGGAPPILRDLFDLSFRKCGSSRSEGQPKKHAQLVITTSFPALLYKARTFAKCDATTPIELSGLEVRTTTFIGSIDTISDHDRQEWLSTMYRSGIANGADG